MNQLVKKGKRGFSKDSENWDCKKSFWKLFRNVFKDLTGKSLSIPIGFIENVKPLFYYFLRYEDFLTSSHLRNDISVPKFEKGLLIIGGYGVGKTVIMRTLEACFAYDPKNRFKMFTANEIVNMYEKCKTQYDKDAFFKRMKSGTICIDDLFTERVANNFGKVDVLKEILEERYALGKKTYITCNYADGFDGDVEATLQVFARRYGNRVYDRFFEMFNIIEFKGKSQRR